MQNKVVKFVKLVKLSMVFKDGPKPKSLRLLLLLDNSMSTTEENFPFLSELSWAKNLWKNEHVKKSNINEKKFTFEGTSILSIRLKIALLLSQFLLPYLILIKVILIIAVIPRSLIVDATAGFVSHEMNCVRLWHT